MREGNRVCGASFVSLAPLRRKDAPPFASLPQLLLACEAGQSGARPAVYVRGIIRISYGAGRGKQKWREEKRKRSAEVGAEEGVRASRRDRWLKEEKEGRRDRGAHRKLVLKIKVLSWPRLIFHYTPKLKMWAVITYLSNCLSWKGACHIRFAKGQGSQAAGRKRVDQRLLIPPNTLQNYLV